MPNAAIDPEKALEQSPLARDVLRLAEDLSLARLAEQVTAMGSEVVEQTLSSVRQQLAAAEGQLTVEALEQAEKLRLRLVDAEADAVHWRRQLAAHRDQRERLEVELKMYAERL